MLSLASALPATAGAPQDDEGWGSGDDGDDGGGGLFGGVLDIFSED